jgi:hypothetical protein
MTLSYSIDPFGAATKRRTVKATITTEHSASSYGQPVIVLPDGGALDLMSWVGCGYRVERATAKERAALDTVFAAIEESA